MKGNPKKLDRTYWDNKGKIVPDRKVQFYSTIGVLCAISQYRYSLFKHKTTKGMSSYFYDRNGERIPNDELDIYYKEKMMNTSSAARYLRAKKLEDVDVSQ